MTTAAPIRDAPLPCPDCGYDLRALPADGRCPECAAPVARALTGDRLRLANEDWTRSLARGLTWIARSTRGLLILILVNVCFALTIGVVFASTTTATRFERAVEILFGGLGLVMLALVITMAIGLWFVSAGDPARAERSRDAGALRAAGLLVIPAFGYWFAARDGASAPNDPWVMPIISTACSIVVWAHIVLVLRHVTTIERRCPERPDDRDRARERQQRRARWLVPLFLALFWIGPFQWSSTGVWSIPDADELLFMAVGLTWYATLRSLNKTREIVTAELA